MKTDTVTPMRRLLTDVRAMHRRLVLRTAGPLTRHRMGGLALWQLSALERAGQANTEVIEALFRTHSKLGNAKEADAYRAKILRGRATRAAKAKGLDRPIQNLLRAMAGLELMNLAAPLPAAARLTELMGADDGLSVLLDASEPVIEEFPQSVTLIYVRAFALAKKERIPEASALVMEATRLTTDLTPDNPVEERRKSARLKNLGKIWRVVDAVARDNMAWLDGGAEADASDSEPNADRGDGAAEADDAPTEAPIESEALLQSRRQGRYLAACRQRFNAEPELREKLIAINDMLRQGLRRLPTYHASYEAARKAYVSVRQMWTPMLAIDDDAVAAKLIGGDGGLKTARVLIQVLQLARELGFEDDVATLESALLALASRNEARTALWTVASVLVNGDPDRFTEATTTLVENAPAPTKAHEVRDFLAWAAGARRHDLAHAYFNAAPEQIRRSYPAIHYVKILQRDGQFNRALTLLRAITASVLATPKSFCPHRHWTLIRRIMEMEFLVDSAKWMRAVPQPTKPKGLIFVSPRNAGLLTRYPMAALLELKKQGWAIVPLVEGVLPLELTGDPDIDQFMGCQLQDVRLNGHAREHFQPISDFNPRVDQGQLTWRDMSFAQSLWEESAVHRRRFNIDYTCPSLQKHLGRLTEWTRLQATVLENAHRIFKRKNLRLAFMVPYQVRMPDVVNRFYCAQYGDPKTFFCVHVSNGYENYFANFKYLISTKAAMRNMTAHPELRSAGFPVPSQFLQWYDARKAYGRAMLDQVRDTTKVRRSTRTAAAPPPEAMACLDRLRAHRAQGGKVACAFGKLVCDMLAPTDGGPAHSNMKDWLNHTIESVRGSDTLLLIKPHPHELRNEIATFLTEYLVDLIEVDIPDNVIISGQDWFDLNDLDGLVDLGLLYNGTTAIELGLMNIPAVVCSDFAPIDYPIGHAVPRNRSHYRKMVRFEAPVKVAEDLPERAAAWIHYMSGDLLTIPYRYHARPLTNKVVMPPRWFDEDITRYLQKGDPNVVRLAARLDKVPNVAGVRTKAVRPKPLPVKAAGEPGARSAATGARRKAPASSPSRRRRTTRAAAAE
ncbi:MAG: hypothetical protein ACI8U3_000091 [Brevundimonas sp.]|jgi:hypothetical protein|uniref:hypothetical protein n=1 Tax=Brevundimonas sp. TaxID=1871086 RepID=UPI0039E48B81